MEDVTNQTIVAFDDRTYEGCDSETVKIDWEGGQHSLEEATGPGCEDDAVITELMPVGFHTVEVLSEFNVTLSPGETRYFRCGFLNHCENGSKFVLTCPPVPVTELPVVD